MHVLHKWLFIIHWPLQICFLITGTESGEFLRSFSSLHGTLAINKYIHLSVYVCVQTIIEMSEPSISVCIHMVQL